MDDDDTEDETVNVSIQHSEGTSSGSVMVRVTDDDEPPPSGTIQVIPSGPLSVNEGGSETLSVSLSTAPNADVTVSLSKTNDDITLSPSSLTFTTTDYGAKSVTINAGEDADTTNDSDTITLSATGGITAPEVTKAVSVTDNDAPSGTIVLDSTATLSIDEGGSGTFTVRLSATPNADVTVSLSKTNDDITLSTTSLTFTTSDWNTPQTVTVSATQDADATDDSDTITIEASGGIDADDVTKAVSVNDDDLPSGSIVLDSTATLTIDEGGSGTFTVRLSATPNADVTVSLSKTNDDITLSTTSLTFTTSDWNTPQTVTVSATQDADAIDDSDTITIEASGGIDADDVTKAVSVNDDDLPSGSIVLDSTATLTIDEGGSGTFTVRLSATPNADVTVSLSKTNDDITLSTTSLTFTTSDWNTPQTVTVSAAQDADATDDSDTITIEASGGIDADDVTKAVSVNDDDLPSGSIVLDSTATLSIDEGGSGTFTVRLSATPNADVTVSLSKTNDDITLSTTSLTFTTSDWNTPQTVTVSATQDADAIDDSDTITLSASGGIDADDVTKAVSVNDDEVAGSIVLDSTATLSIDEGGSGTFTVRLSATPNADVTVSLSKTNDDITLSTTSLTFTTSDWNTPQTVTVSATQDADAIDDSDTITLSASGGIDADDVTKAVSVDDDEVAGSIVLDSTATLTIDEGGSGSFTVRLSAAPNADVTVSLSKTNDDIILSTTSLTFTASDWNTPQTVTVSAPQDDDATSESDTITLSASGGIIAPGVRKNVRITDDDAPSGTILTSPADRLNLDEGGSKSIAVRLSSRPNTDVTVSLSTTGDAIALDKTSLTFTASDWSAPQTVLVTAAQDSDTTAGSDTITLIASGGIDAPDISLSVSIEDDDTPGGISLSPSGTLEVVEGGRATLGVSLTTRPSVASISVSLSKTDPNLTLNPASLTFTSSNWSETQSVIVVAAEDDDVEDSSDTITLTLDGGGNYASVPDLSVLVRILDSPGEFTLTPTILNLIEGGDSADLQVRLDTRPIGTSSVVVRFTADLSGLEISPAVLIFPADRWEAPRSVTVRAIDDSNALDERTTITATAIGGNYRSVQRTATVQVQDNGESTPLPPIKSQALAFPPVGAQDNATLRLRCKQDSPCEVVLDCHAQTDGSTFEGKIPDPIPAWGTRTLTAEDIERHTGASWAGKGRLGCALRSEENLGSQVWTRSGDGVLVNNSAFIPSVPEGDKHRADIESIPEPGGTEKTNLRIRCLAPEGSDCTAVRLACYDDEGAHHDGEIGTIERLSVRHIQTMEIAERIDHRWQGMGLVCEIRSSAPFTIQVLTRTGGGGALVNNSATGVR